MEISDVVFINGATFLPFQSWSHIVWHHFRTHHLNCASLQYDQLFPFDWHAHWLNRKQSTDFFSFQAVQAPVLHKKNDLQLLAWASSVRRIRIGLKKMDFVNYSFRIICVDQLSNHFLWYKTLFNLKNCVQKHFKFGFKRNWFTIDLFLLCYSRYEYELEVSVLLLSAELYAYHG